MRWEEKSKYGVDLPESGGVEFGLNYSIEYHQLVTPIVIMGGSYPRAGSLEDQDPRYLEDLQVIYRLRNRIMFDLREEGYIAQLQKTAKNMQG